MIKYLFFILLIIYSFLPLNEVEGASKASLMQEDLGLCNPSRFGTALTGATLSSAIASTGTGTLPDCSTSSTLLITKGEWQITTNLSIPTRFQVLVPNGATIVIAAGVTLTGCIDAEEYTIFTGVGNLIVPSNCNKSVKAAWFPKTSAGLTLADSAAHANGISLELSSGTWALSTALTINSMPTFHKGAIINPASGIDVTFTQCPQAGHYKIFLADGLTSGTILAQCAEWSSAWFGTLGDGTTDDGPAFTNWCRTIKKNHQALSTAQMGRVPGGKKYIINSTVQCHLADDTFDQIEAHFFAHGATLKLTANVPMWIWNNPSTSCTTLDGTWAEPFVRRIWWYGGTFEGPTTTATELVSLYPESTMMKAYGVRGFYIYDTFATFFHNMLDVCVQDNLQVRGNRWGSYVYGITQPDVGMDEVLAPFGGQSSTIIDIDHNNLGAGEECNTNINLVSGAIQNATIDNNSIAGGCSNAWIDIVTGETLARDNQGISISGNTHEQADDNAFGYRIRQRAGSTKRLLGLTIVGNEMRFSSTTGFTAMHISDVDGAVIQGNFIESQNAVNYTGIILEDVQSLQADGNHFETTHGAGLGTGTCWKLLGTINRVGLGSFTCGEPTVVNDDALGISERWRWSIGHGWRFFAGDVDLMTSYDGGNNLDSTDSGTLFMSTGNNMGSGWIGGQFPPRGYYLRIQMRSTTLIANYALVGGAGTDANVIVPSVRVSQLVTTPEYAKLLCYPTSPIVSAWTNCEGYVQADVDGNVYVQINSFAVDTIRLRITVLAVID